MKQNNEYSFSVSKRRRIASIMHKGTPTQVNIIILLRIIDKHCYANNGTIVHPRSEGWLRHGRISFSLFCLQLIAARDLPLDQSTLQYCRRKCSWSSYSSLT